MVCWIDLTLPIQRFGGIQAMYLPLEYKLRSETLFSQIIGSIWSAHVFTLQWIMRMENTIKMGMRCKYFKYFHDICKKSKCWYSFVRSNDISTHVFCLELKYILNNTPKVSNMEKLMVFRRTDNLTIFNKREKRKLWSLKQTVSKLQCLKKV